MYATHHKTGKQIRILNNNTATWKDNKTLVWLKPEDVLNNPWDRYEIGCVGSENCMKIKNVGVVVCVDMKDVEWIKKGGASQVNLIFASKKILDEIGIQFFEEKKIRNVLCLEELHLLYTFIEKAWDGSINDACVLVGLVLRFSNSFPLENSDRNLFNLKLSNVLVPPKPLYFITQYYTPKNTARAREIQKCLYNNIANKYIDKIILLNESDLTSKIKSNKLEQVVIKKRLTYADVIQYIAEKIPEDVNVVFANADIYLDETIRSVWACNLENKFFALLRYDVNEKGKSEIFGPRPDSQDTWILSSSSVKQRKWNYGDLEFSFGMSGCDNAITTEMLRAKFLVVNPALTILTHHLHLSNYRTYDMGEIVDKKVYLYIEPTGLHDMEALTNLPTNNICDTIKLSSFNRVINSKKAGTFCKMLEKEKRYNFDVSGNNTYEAQTVPVYKFQNIFQTNTGLTYNYDKIFVGPSKIATEYWSKSNLSTLTPSIHIKKGYVAPLPENINSVENYVLYYLSKILLLRDLYGNDGDFWCPNKKEYLEMLSIFNWKTKQLPLLSQTENQLVYMDESYVWFPRDNIEVSREEVSKLRNFLVDVNSDEKSIVVYMDEEYINKNFITELEAKYGDVKIIFPQTSIDRKLRMLQNASKLFIHCSKKTEHIWKYIWAVKPNTELVDIQNEMELNGEVHHLASACGLNHKLHIVPRGTLSVFYRNKIFLNGEEEQVSLPTIYVPNVKEGLFGHKGDSFREMIDLWEEKKYIKKEINDCKNVWMNGVGEILLYDRPTYDWIKQADSKEQSWKKALFGNPKPIGLNSKSWSFWPRRPGLVEAMLNQTFEKTQELVFYGKIENQVQKTNRTKYDWSSVCDKYYMANENETPLLSEQEYLDKLSEAKYGLCLAGYGKKCHREVECMALGTVPVCAPEVDMTNYANPPVEGTHYLRVENPMDAKEKISQISEEQWLEKSKACKMWYKENCSVEGMWQLTKKLIND